MGNDTALLQKCLNVNLSFFLSQILFTAGEVLEGVCGAPQNKEESRRNVEQVLQFISSRHIRMTHISARGKSQKMLCFLALFLLILRIGFPNLFYLLTLYCSHYCIALPQSNKHIKMTGSTLHHTKV